MRFILPNPVPAAGINPVAMIDSYLDEGVYPGDIMIDDLQVASDIYLEEVWRAIPADEFEVPEDLAEAVRQDRIHLAGAPGHIRREEADRIIARMTAEDVIELYREQVKDYCDTIKEGKDAEGHEFDGYYGLVWWETMSYLQGLLVFGDDRLGVSELAMGKDYWNRWMPQNQARETPTLERFRMTMVNAGGQEAMDRMIASCEHLFTQGPGPQVFIDKAENQVLDEDGRGSGEVMLDEDGNTITVVSTQWFMDRQTDGSMLEYVNRGTFMEWLADYSEFDCKWAIHPTNRTPVYMQIALLDFYLKLLRPSGLPTLLAYYDKWFMDVATNNVSEPADPEAFAAAERRQGISGEGGPNLPADLQWGELTASVHVQDRLPVVLDLVDALLPAVYEQLQAGPWGAIPAHATEDPEADWWDEQGEQLLEDLVAEVNEELRPFGAYLGGADFGIWRGPPQPGDPADAAPREPDEDDEQEGICGQCHAHGLVGTVCHGCGRGVFEPLDDYEQGMEDADDTDYDW